MINILVPIDGSGHSERIIAELLKTVKLYRDPVQVHLVNVQPPVPYANKVSHAIGHEVVDGYLREQGELALRPARAAFDAAGVGYKHYIETGEPADIILRIAGETGCTQIFMGTHGRGAVSGLVLGSVATKVIHLATIPVTLVRQ